MADTLLVKDKDIVVPGEILGHGMGYLPSTGIYRDGEELIAGRLGMISMEGKVITLIPLAGRYMPKVDDKIICKVSDVLMTGWRVQTNSPYEAVLTLKDGTSDYVARGADLTQYFAIGDLIVCKVAQVTSQKLVDVSMRGPGLQKLHGGRIIEVSSHKIPRIIGKEGSMMQLIKTATGCNIVIGQNGWIWISGEPSQEVRAVQAIKKIEEEAHLSGLTDRITTFLGAGA